MIGRICFLAVLAMASAATSQELEPRTYSNVTSFLAGACWADNRSLESFREFVCIRLTEPTPDQWELDLLFKEFGRERARSIVEGDATVEENDRALEILFDAQKGYFIAKENGELREIQKEFDRARPTQST